MAREVALTHGGLADEKGAKSTDNSTSQQCPLRLQTSQPRIHLSAIQNRIDRAVSLTEMCSSIEGDTNPRPASPFTEVPTSVLYDHWANTYDARKGDLVWWWGRKAARLDPAASVVEEGSGDVVLPDGGAAWIDGGPRRPWAPDEVGDLAVVHSETVDGGSLMVLPPPADPRAELAPGDSTTVGAVSW